MRLLFDQNLSFKLCQMIADLFPDSSHVRSHGLSEVADGALWEFAKANGFAIVTQAAAFAELAPLLGSPPKWFGFGPAIKRRRRLRLCFAVTRGRSSPSRAMTALP